MEFLNPISDFNIALTQVLMEYFGFCHHAAVNLASGPHLAAVMIALSSFSKSSRGKIGVRDAATNSFIFDKSVKYLWFSL